MSEIQPLFIDGVWREGSSGAAGPIINPATEEAIGLVAHAGPDDVAAAIAAAQQALPAWRDTRPDRRAAILKQAADVIAARAEAAATALTREQGKTLAESRAEYARVVETLAWHARHAEEVLEPRRGPGRTDAADPPQPHLRAVRPPRAGAHEPSATSSAATESSADGSGIVIPEPIGVVGAFTPWNYPAVTAARKLAAALTAGCPVILKGAEEAPSAACVIVGALEEAGLPPGVVNLVFGDPPAISMQVLDAPAVQAFSFTGSTIVGRALAERASRRLTRCVLELGGHAPVLVLADADLDAAVPAIAAYKFECAGQSCNAPSRIYVEASAYEPFVERFAAIARGLHVGDGLDPSTDMGPMANPRRLTAMTRLTDEARARGARVVTGGARLPRRGYFWSPTILVDVPDTAALMTEEAFGPIVPISPFTSLDEAIARANANPYGLAAYVFTRSAARAKTVTRALAVGSVGINELRGVPPDMAIAGIKDSGYGYEGGRLGIEAFLNLKVVRGTW